MDGSGILYVVGTPIGNLKDITIRAIETLKTVSAIISEDTRRTKKLLANYKIKKPLFSIHSNTEKIRCQQFIERLLEGDNLALVSDAGMPALSDPGRIIISNAYKQGIKITVIPGPSAITASIALAGLNTEKFIFEGFLSRSPSKRKTSLERLKNYDYPILFFESPKRIRNTINELYSVLGNRKVSITREITKIYESVIIKDFKFLVESNAETYLPEKGEYTIIVEGAKQESQKLMLPLSDEEIKKYLLKIIPYTKSLKTAVILTADILGIPKNKVYKLALEVNTRALPKIL